MKKSTRIAAAIVVAFLGIAVIANMFFPNIVSGVPPVREAGDSAKALIDKIKSAENKDSAIVQAVFALPTHGGTLEERVAYWVGIVGGSHAKIDSMHFLLLSGVGITAEMAEGRVAEGYGRDEVVVRVFSQGKSEDYFLRCANGLVSKRWPGAISERRIGATYIATDQIAVPVSVSSRIVFIPNGGSLCETLGMTKQEARKFAKKNKMKHWEKDGKLYVLIMPGDAFEQTADGWQKV
jgi:hypothetical protein